MASLTITEAEILEAIAQSRKPGIDGAQTLQDMTAATGLPESKVRKALAAYQRDNRLSVHRVRRIAIDGTYRQIPAYIILPKKGKQ